MIKVDGEHLGQHFERHISVELGVSCLTQVAHAAFADLGYDEIEAKTNGLSERPGPTRLGEDISQQKSIQLARTRCSDLLMSLPARTCSRDPSRDRSESVLLLQGF